MRMRGPRYFYFALARELKMPVRELLERTDSAELTEWMAYFRAETTPPEPEPETVAEKIKKALLPRKI